MSSAESRLPPLKSIVAFEAAARLSSFTAAARELHLTQPAVSQRIVELEADLGVPLFVREHRGVRLTREGTRLYDAACQSLMLMRSAALELRATRRPREALTVATDGGFAGFWLMPRLDQLALLMPDVDVHIQTSQDDFDARRDNVDLAVAFGCGDWPGCRSRQLLPERVVPVCSPAYARSARLHSAADLVRCRLLHVQDVVPARWMTWADWFEAQGLARDANTPSLVFDSYSLVVQAAVIGQGVALGWAPLVDELLASGQLVAAVPTPLLTERGYFIVQPDHKSPSPALRTFSDWLVASAAGACAAVATAANSG